MQLRSDAVATHRRSTAPSLPLSPHPSALDPALSDQPSFWWSINYQSTAEPPFFTGEQMAANLTRGEFHDRRREWS